MDNNKNYYIILSRWNGEKADDMIHTFMIDKDTSYNKKFHAYNYDCWRVNNTTDENDYLNYFGGSISNTYICAYFVDK